MTAKEYLSQYIDLEGEIKAKKEELIRLDDLSKNITPKMSDGSAHGLNVSDKVGNVTCQIVYLQNLIEANIKYLLNLRLEIMQCIDAVDNITYRTLLHNYYILGKSFEQVAVYMGYSWRHVIRLHGQALQQIVVPKS